jgi:hypothetical protein|tara:strand:- start:37 stop:642 length:606 start_codon:yes stop_codon:yes gene_type:complete
MSKSTIKRNKKRTNKIKRKLIKRNKLKRGGSDFAFSDFEIPGYNRRDKLINKTIKNTSSSVVNDVFKKGIEKAKRKVMTIEEENEKLLDKKERELLKKIKYTGKTFLILNYFSNINEVINDNNFFKIEIDDVEDIENIEKKEIEHMIHRNFIKLKNIENETEKKYIFIKLCIFIKLYFLLHNKIIIKSSKDNEYEVVNNFQ